jgi:hypothetical protein
MPNTSSEVLTISRNIFNCGSIFLTFPLGCNSSSISGE